MGTFACRCGNIISDVSSPSPFVGVLKWEPELDVESVERDRNVKDFLLALKNGEDKSWVKEYFGEQYAEKYPDLITESDAIEDIATKASGISGHSVYQCPECERIYIQKEFYTDEWICYEKAK